MDQQSSSFGVGLAPADPPPDLLAALRRQWRTIVVVTALGLAAALLYSLVQATEYEARSSVLLIASEDEESPGGGRDRTLDVETWASVARSTSLLNDLAIDLEMEFDEVKRRTTATAAPTGDVLVLTYTADVTEDAVEGARAYSERFLLERDDYVNSANVARQAELDRLAEQLTDQIDQIADEIAAQEALGEDGSPSRLAVLTSTEQDLTRRLAEILEERATVDTQVDVGRVLIDPSSSVQQTGLGRALVLLAGLLLGALLGLVAALLRDRYDDRYGSLTDPALIGAHEIMRVPYRDRNHPRDPSDGYHRLAARLAFSRRRRTGTGNTVLLLPVETSTMPGDVARTVAKALEAAFDPAIGTIRVYPEPDRAADGEPDDSVGDEIEQARRTADIVIVPAVGLDKSALGIALSAVVDEVVLMVTPATPVHALVNAMSDLHAVDVNARQVLVLTDVHRHHLHAARQRSHVVESDLGAVPAGEITAPGR